MGVVYGNVNVNYSYCKSVAQLKSAADYILGRRKEQVEDGVVKTEPHLYKAFGCNRDNFANSLLITRKMHDKRYSRYKQELLCRGWFLPPNTYDCGSFVVNGTAVVGKEQNIPYNC